MSAQHAAGITGANILTPYLWPLAVFAPIGISLGIGLRLDPRLVPSPLVGVVTGKTIDERLPPPVRRLRAE